MSDKMLMALSALKGFAQESALTRSNEDALPDIVEKANAILEHYMALDPEDSYWKVAKPVEGAAGFGKVGLLCTLLEEYVEAGQTANDEAPCWHIVRSETLVGAYKGHVVVAPGAKFNLCGSVQGKVILHGDAVFACMGCLDGDVEADDESIITCPGVISGSIIRRGNAQPDGEPVPEVVTEPAGTASAE